MVAHTIIQHTSCRILTCPPEDRNLQQLPFFCSLFFSCNYISNNHISDSHSDHDDHDEYGDDNEMKGIVFLRKMKNFWLLPLPATMLRATTWINLRKGSWGSCGGRRTTSKSCAAASHHHFTLLNTNLN